MASKQVGRWRKVAPLRWERSNGGRVLATITWVGDHRWRWEAAGATGECQWYIDAQRAARKALAEPGGPQATAGGKGGCERDV